MPRASTIVFLVFLLCWDPEGYLKRGFHSPRARTFELKFLKIDLVVCTQSVRARKQYCEEKNPEIFFFLSLIICATFALFDSDRFALKNLFWKLEKFFVQKSAFELRELFCTRFLNICDVNDTI